MTNLTTYYNIHGLTFKIETPHNSVAKYYQNRLNYFKTNYTPKPDIYYYIGDFDKPRELSRMGSKMRFGNNLLLWQPLPKAKIILKDLSKTTQIFMTKLYRGIFSDYLTTILRTKLVMKNKTLLHCAGICSNNNATLLTGFGNTGKSSLTYELIKDGLSYLGDDHVIVSSLGKVFSFPTGMGIDYSTINKLNISIKPKKKLEAIIRPLLPFTYSSVVVNPINSELHDSANIGNIIILEKDSKNKLYKFYKPNESVFLKKLQSVTLTWANQIRGWSKLINSYSYVDDDYCPTTEVITEKYILEDILYKANKYILKFNLFNEAKQMIKEVMYESSHIT